MKRQNLDKKITRRNPPESPDTDPIGRRKRKCKGMIGIGATNGRTLRSSRTIAVISAFNEESTVAAVVRGTIPDVPVIVIDDGSSDLTGAQAASAGAQVLRHCTNEGKGAALRTGFRRALADGYNSVITLDADGQHNPSQIPRFLSAHRASPEVLIVGSRDFAKMPFIRGLSNHLARIALRMTLGNDLRDSQCGYRLVPEWLVRKLLGSIRNGFNFELEMILAYLASGLAIKWVPIGTIYKGDPSHIKPLRHVVEFLQLALHPRGVSIPIVNGDRGLRPSEYLRKR